MNEQSISRLSNSDLHRLIVDNGSSNALDELGGRANGNNPEARQLIADIDSRHIAIQNEVEPSQASQLADAMFVITHPGLVMRTALRRHEVGMDMASPPEGSNIEEFPVIPFVAAMRLMANQTPKQ